MRFKAKTRVLTVLCLVGTAQAQEAENKPGLEEERVQRFKSLPIKEKLIFAVRDKELLAARAQLADLSGAGDNPYIGGFPAPRAYSSNPV